MCKNRTTMYFLHLFIALQQTELLFRIWFCFVLLYYTAHSLWRKHSTSLLHAPHIQVFDINTSKCRYKYPTFCNTAGLVERLQNCSIKVRYVVKRIAHNQYSLITLLLWRSSTQLLYCWISIISFMAVAFGALYVYSYIDQILLNWSTLWRKHKYSIRSI